MGIGIGLGLSTSTASKVEQPMKYLFVDGNYFVLRLREIAQKSGLALEENLDPANMAASFDRLFYYDAMPTKRDGKDDEQFKREVGEKTAFLDRIRRSAKCHVRDGLSVPRALLSKSG
jgi:hypothetical protein